ncbi:helix-turn-helix transcriptional regulator [Parasedimentitalea maritima]|uniref:Helix-turn-helix transcriptional regulator n=2 Tax=Parasedimentitalea maritima TaxID=2578117 RepID=A0ABY2UQQ7_9RHOB|nr:helix-turn-helix transcriptional regulator [Zongyanglinia marina]
MQEKSTRTPNADRRAMMRKKLMDAARSLFVEKGFAATSTPEIVKSAQVTRGALYHHFEDKEDLFRAVVVAEAKELRQAIEVATKGTIDDPLGTGSKGYFEAMSIQGRAQLLLIDGPAVLGVQEMDQIDAGGGRAALRTGLITANPDLSDEGLEAVTKVLSAGYDRAALAIAQGEAAKPYEQAMAALVRATIS